MPENIDCVEALTLFNETCQAVKRFDEVQMTQLAMVVEFTGFSSSTEVTSIARLLGEFEVNPFVHNDEEYGKYMVEESGLFDVDELLLPHINYAAFAADKRQGTLVQSGYVENGFVGATRELSEYQQYNGVFVRKRMAKSSYLPPLSICACISQIILAISSLWLLNTAYSTGSPASWFA